MKNFVLGAVVTIAIGFAPLASANNYGFSSQNQHSVDITAGFNVTIPLGQQRFGKVEDKSRIGFRLGLTESYESRNRVMSTYKSVDMLELGMRLDGKPNILLSGQDIYTPLFTTLHADDSTETDTTSGGGNKSGNGGTVLLIAGAVVVSAAVITIGTKEALEDSFEDIFD